MAEKSLLQRFREACHLSRPQFAPLVGQSASNLEIIERVMNDELAVRCMSIAQERGMFDYVEEFQRYINAASTAKTPAQKAPAAVHRMLDEIQVNKKKAQAVQTVISSLHADLFPVPENSENASGS